MCANDSNITSKYEDSPNCFSSFENEVRFHFTQDGSTGLYNTGVEDVYHSIYGAKTEAEEKFVLPLNFENNFINKNNIKVLDICYGIGYNTKAFLKKIITTNYNGQITIDALEYNKNLVLLSPFIKDGYEDKYPEISFILLRALAGEIHSSSGFIKYIITHPQYRKFIAPFYRRLIKKFKYLTYSYNPLKSNNRFLHNIHYHCISSRNKKHLKPLKINKIIFNSYYEDARKSIKLLNGPYDIIFLDAFTPTKLPTLWSYDFFKCLNSLSNDDTILLTYSNSAAVRHAMIDAGFYAGKLFDKEGRCCGTIATHNKNFILNPLDEYDCGLMKTGAGVYYRDKDINLTAAEILEEYAIRKKELNLESSSHYNKFHKREKVNAKI